MEVLKSIKLVIVKSEQEVKLISCKVEFDSEDISARKMISLTATLDIDGKSIEKELPVYSAREMDPDESTDTNENKPVDCLFISLHGWEYRNNYCLSRLKFYLCRQKVHYLGNDVELSYDSIFDELGNIHPQEKDKPVYYDTLIHPVVYDNVKETFEVLKDE